MTSNPLHLAARHGRLLLVAGLVAGIALPQLALFMRDYLAHMVATLLFLNAFRIGTSATLGSKGQLKKTLLTAVLLQLAIPCLFLAFLFAFAIEGPVATALVILASAASISGSPNLTAMLGHDPASSQRLLIVGTAILPLTILPVFALSPQLGDPEVVVGTALRLLAVIVVSAGLAYFLRARLFAKLTTAQLKNVDGLSTIVMSVLVIGLMSALGPAVFNDPAEVLVVAAIAFAVNYGMQIACFLALSWRGNAKDRVGTSIVAGNRNMALFLAALPAAITDPILLFIACYQLPMYLTPIVMRKFYPPGAWPEESD